MGAERRRYSRFPVHADQAEVLVQIAETVMPARIRDQSATGMHILLPAAAPPVQVGSIVWLQGEAGCTEARVVHVSPEQGGTHLGLERLRDVPHLPQGIDSLPWWRRVPTLVNLNFATLGIGLGLVLLIPLAIYGVFFVVLDKGRAEVQTVVAATTDARAKSASPATRKAEPSRDARVQVMHDLFQTLPVDQLVKDLRLGGQQETQVRAVLDAWKLLESNGGNASEFARLSREHVRMVRGLDETQRAQLRSALDAQLASLPKRAGSSPVDRNALLDHLFTEPRANAGGKTP